MADETGTGLPDVSEPKVGPERIVHEKEDKAFDSGGQLPPKPR